MPRPPGDQVIGPSEAHARKEDHQPMPGIDEGEGRYRLMFFSESQRLRLAVDEKGNVSQRSAIDFSNPPLPRSGESSDSAPIQDHEATS